MRKENSIINRVAAYVKTYPGYTGAEISDALGSPGAYRRLSEIRKLGLIKMGPYRTCTISGKSVATWYPDDRDVETVVDRGGETQEQMRRRMQGRIDFLVNENYKIGELVDSLRQQLATVTAERDELRKSEARVLADRNYIIGQNINLAAERDALRQQLT